MEASLFTNWLILRPLLVLGLTWAAIVVAVIAGWIRRRVAAYSQRESSESRSAHLVSAGTQVLPVEFGPVRRRVALPRTTANRGLSSSSPRLLRG